VRKIRAVLSIYHLFDHQGVFCIVEVLCSDLGLKFFFICMDFTLTQLHQLQARHCMCSLCRGLLGCPKMSSAQKRKETFNIANTLGFPDLGSG